LTGLLIVALTRESINRPLARCRLLSYLKIQNSDCMTFQTPTPQQYLKIIVTMI